MKKRRHTPTRESWERLQIEYRAGQLRRAGVRKPLDLGHGVDVE